MLFQLDQSLQKKRKRKEEESNFCLKCAATQQIIVSPVHHTDGFGAYIKSIPTSLGTTTTLN